MLNEVLKIFGKIIPADLRKLIKTKGNKRSGGSILQIFIRSTLKTWKTVYKSMCFSFNFVYSMHFAIVRYKKKGVGWGEGGGSCLTDKIC